MPIFFPSPPSLMTWMKLQTPIRRGAEETVTGGTAMKHFTTAEWIDFVNQMTPFKKQEAMREHLESGCKVCEEKFVLWQKVRGTAASEANYQPSADAVPGGKAAFSSSKNRNHKQETKPLLQ